MIRLLIILLALLLVVQPVYAAPDTPVLDHHLYLPAISGPDQTGSIRHLNCNYGQAARVVWFLNNPGTLYAIWAYANFHADVIEVARDYMAPSRGRIYVQMPPMFGYKLVFVTWGYTGTGFVETSFCGALE